MELSEGDSACVLTINVHMSIGAGLYEISVHPVDTLRAMAVRSDDAR